MLSEADADYRGEIAVETEDLARWLTRFRGSAAWAIVLAAAWAPSPSAG
jgi:hypothetical protein